MKKNRSRVTLPLLLDLHLRSKSLNMKKWRRKTLPRMQRTRVTRNLRTKISMTLLITTKKPSNSILTNPSTITTKLQPISS